MKKILIIFLVAAMTLICFCGCGSSDASSSDRLSVVATTFPPYDFTRAVAGDAVELTMLLSPETESHGFEPTLRDIAAIQDCDVFICIGGESEAWVDDVLAQVDTSSITVVRLMDSIDPLEAVLSEGADEHSHDDHCDHDAHEYEEHIWTSPRNVMLMSETIRDVLCGRDPENSSLYTENCTEYTAQLSELDAELTELTANAARRTLVFAERFPFAYLAEHYSLDHYAAFTGCSSDSEASLSTIAFLVERVEEENIPVVFHIEFSDETVADTICEATGARKLLLHSCHNMTQEDFDAGVTYLDLMRGNIENLREALN